jgi:hypothetical protein
MHIEIHYTTFDPNADGFETARDIRTFADPDLVTSTSFASAYEQVSVVDVTATDLNHIGTDTDTDSDALLDEIYRRLQGGRHDDVLGYDGSETRSAMLGDIIVLGTDAYLVGEIATFPELGDIRAVDPERVSG